MDKSETSVKAILFDVDGVLIDSFEANLKFFQDLMIASGYQQPSRDEYSQMFHLNLKSTINTLTGPISEEEFSKIYKMAHSRETGYDTSLVNTPEDVEEVLESLSKQYILGIVTSRIRNSVYEVPDLKKLKNYFKIAVAYEDTKNHKPDPEPLLLAAQQLGVEPEDVVYIGDTQTDVEAARAAGMKVITYPDKLDGSDAHAKSFKDLPLVVALI